MCRENTTKFAILKVDGRKKKVSYLSSQGKSDLQSVREALRALADKDESLAKTFRHDPTIAFEVFDDDVEGMVEVQDDDVLKSPCTLDVRFFYCVSPSKINDIAPIPTLSNIAAIPPLLMDPSESTPVSGSSTSHSEEVIEPLEINADHGEPNKHVHAMSSDDEDNLSLQGPAVKKPRISSKPGDLPQLPEDLQSMIDELENGGNSAKKYLLSRKDSFIRFWTTHLATQTESAPTRREYANLGKSIVAKYPIFAIGTEKQYKLVIKEISSCLRNRKYYANHKGKKKQGKDTSKTSKYKPSAKASLSRPATPPENPPNSDEDTLVLLEELKKLTKISDITHAKFLLKPTFALRRKWVESAGGRCADIMKEFACLLNAELVLYEYELLGFPLEKAEENMPAFHTKLQIYCGDEESNCFSLIKQIEKESTPARDFQSAIHVRKVFESLDTLETSPKESPKLVVYLDGKHVKTAFVVADGSVSIELNDPSICKCPALFLGFYYVTQTEYPKSYRNILSFLDTSLMGVPYDYSKKNVVARTLRKWNALVSS